MFKATTPLNVNFYDTDFDLHAHLLNECVKAKGIDTIYLPREYQKVDLILGEDVLSKFTTKFPMKLYLANFSGFEGEGSLFGQFGLHVTEQVNFEIDIAEFNTITNNYHPIEQDLIYVPMGEWILELFFVGKNDPYYHLGKDVKYIFQTRRFEYSHEEMDTDIAELDSLNNLSSTDIESENDAIEDDINDILNTTKPNYFGDR